MAILATRIRIVCAGSDQKNFAALISRRKDASLDCRQATIETTGTKLQAHDRAFTRNCHFSE